MPYCIKGKVRKEIFSLLLGKHLGTIVQALPFVHALHCHWIIITTTQKALILLIFAWLKHGHTDNVNTAGLLYMW